MIKIQDLFDCDWKAVWGDEIPTVGVGVVYTKPEIVAWILDLVGYTEFEDLPRLRLLDPGCGAGAFTLEAVRRLASCVSRSGSSWSAGHLCDAITAVDVDG